MNRRHLLKGMGALGLTALLPVNKVTALGSQVNDFINPDSGCWLTPQKTEGPYYFDPGLIRSDITEGRAGMPLQMTLTVQNNACLPIPNVMVDVWHADKDGNYSGYNGFVGQTFMRGTLFTNALGQVVFNTVYPGWYTGRATHIHFKVRLNATTFVTSQWCFLDSVNNAVYATSQYSAHGQNPITNAQDGIFGSAAPQYLVMDAVANGTTSYTGTYTIGIDSPTGIEQPNEMVNGFMLEQNYPNPFNPSTNIVYHIGKAGEVKLAIYDMLGKEVKVIVNRFQQAGRYEVKFNAENLHSGSYFYKLTAANEFIDTKEMLLIK